LAGHKILGWGNFLSSICPNKYQPQLLSPKYYQKQGGWESLFHNLPELHSLTMEPVASSTEQSNFD
jgi:hypothetical protein